MTNDKRPREWCHICGECVVCGNGAIVIAEERDEAIARAEAAEKELYKMAGDRLDGEWPIVKQLAQVIAERDALNAECQAHIKMLAEKGVHVALTWSKE